MALIQIAARHGGDRPDRLPAEVALVCACIAWPPGAARTERIRRAHALGGIACERIAQVAIRHGVSGLVAQGLRDAALPVPERLDRAARRCGVAALRQANEALRLQALLLAAGIPVLSLKGSSLAQCAYGEIGLRNAVDIDLVVAPAHLERAWRVVAGAGYDTVIPRRPLSGTALKLFRWAAKDSYHRHRDEGFVVELHWRLSDDLADPALPPSGQWRAVEIAPGQHLATLNETDLFLYACVHGAAHLWARLKWLADIGALISTSGDGGAAYWQAAQASGASRAVASGFRLTHRLLGVPLPPGFQVRSSLRLRLLEAMAVRAITVGGGGRDYAATPYRGWGELTAKLLIAPRAANVLAIVRRIFISGEDIGSLALPAPLLFLYPLARFPMLITRRTARASHRKAAS